MPNISQSVFDVAGRQNWLVIDIPHRRIAQIIYERSAFSVYRAFAIVWAYSGVQKTVDDGLRCVKDQFVIVRFAHNCTTRT